MDWACDQIYSEFAEDHPARRFVIAFYELRHEVVGRDIPWPDRPVIDQQWNSKLFRRQFSFTSFAYTFISYTLTMDEWFDDRFATELSHLETGRIAMTPLWNGLLDECVEAANRDENEPILRFVDQTRETLDLGIEASGYRIGATKQELLARWGQDPQSAADAYLEQSFPKQK